MLTVRYSNEYPGGVLKIEPKHRRRKLPWYDHLFGLVGVPMVSVLVAWLHDFGVSPLIVIFGALAAGAAAGYLAVRAGKWLSGRFPAFETERISYFDRWGR